MSMKNSNDTIGNRTRDLPVCSAVLQPTAPPAACPTGVFVLLLNAFKWFFYFILLVEMLDVASEFFFGLMLTLV
jgi:hypothetical protein